MIPTAQHLYKSILLRAAEEWGIEGYDDVERDIGQAFDPLVRFMAGATASELEKVYQHINDAESRLMDRIVRVLLPEHYHLPRPAHALAIADPQQNSFLADETTNLVYTSDDGTASYHFTPVFLTRLLPVKPLIFATENEILELAVRPRRRKSMDPITTEFRRLVIGFEAKSLISDWDQTCLWFDIDGKSEGDDERAALFKGLLGVQVSLQGHSLRIKSGLPESKKNLEDYLDGNSELESFVNARYKRHYITFLQNEISEIESVVPGEYLTKWFGSMGPTAPQLAKYISSQFPEEQPALYWLRIDFPHSIHIQNIGETFRIRFNVFPVINRRRWGHGKGEHHYLQTNALKWINVQPEEPFLAIRKVYEEKPPENPVFLYKPFADFKEDKSPSYTVRYGGLGRWDELNAWRRLGYVVSLFQENYTHQELIQRAADTLSLEDVHYLLGKKIESTNQLFSPTSDIYLLLHPGSKGGIRVRAEYWTSMGASANRIPARSKLTCSTALALELETESLELLTTTSDGAAPLDTSAQLTALKHALLSRGRLVTRADVLSFCKTIVQDKISHILIKDGVGKGQGNQIGMTRQLEVWLEPAKDYIDLDWEAICHQLQVLIEERITSVVPVWVGVELRSKSEKS